jgi:Tol biopolymer transport system component
VKVPDVSLVDHVIDLNTGVVTPLSEAIIDAGIGQYAASPDGSLLAYVGISGGRDQIFIAGIDGTGVRQVTQRRNGARSPAWSPDGTRIAYEGLDSEHVRSLFVLDVASGESTKILTFGSPVRSGPGPLPGLEPQFTPDGSSLLYSAGSYEQPVLRIVPVAGGKSSIFIGPGGGLAGAGNGSLSPDGSLVTFLGSEAGGPGPGRWVANADGTERRHLSDVYGLPCMANPAGTWSPDGSRIVCAEASKIIVIDIATGGASPVADGRGAIWLDDHTLLVSP